MANVLHSTLTGTDLHESKGAATAASGQVAIANGVGNAVFGTLAYSQISGTPTLAPVATTGFYADLTGKPTLATVATSGSYNDLSNNPVIPQVYNGATLSTAPLIKCYTVTSSAGLWSVSLSGFTTVYNVQATAISGGASTAAATAVAGLSSVSASSVSGTVVILASPPVLGTAQVIHVTVVGV